MSSTIFIISALTYNYLDLLITVNFTTLQIPAGTINNTSFNSLQIMVGLNNDTQKVIERTTGTTLIPGTNLFGTVTWDFRQVLKNPYLSSFGLFDVSDIGSLSTFFYSWEIILVIWHYRSVADDQHNSRPSRVPSHPTLSRYRYFPFVHAKRPLWSKEHPRL